MNNKDNSEFIFTLSCPDTSGIVAEVAGFMAKSNLTIKESNQFGDSETNSFFMRVKALSINGNDKIDINDIRNNFKLIAKKRKMEFNIYNANEVPKIIIMVSKFDHCLVDLLYRVKIGELKAKIVAIISNHSDTEMLANSYGIPFHYIKVTNENKKSAENALEQLITKYNAEAIILARYMQILSKEISDKYSSKIINIHHKIKNYSKQEMNVLRKFKGKLVIIDRLGKVNKDFIKIGLKNFQKKVIFDDSSLNRNLFDLSFNPLITKVKKLKNNYIGIKNFISPIYFYKKKKIILVMGFSFFLVITIKII